MERIFRQKHNFTGLLVFIFINMIIVFSFNSALFAKIDEQYLNSKRTLKFSYSVLVKNIPSNSKSLEVWIPAPQSDGHQTVSDLKILCGLPYTLQNESEYNNSILAIKSDKNIPGNFPVSMEFLVTRTGYKVSDKLIDPNDAQSSEYLKRCLMPDNLAPTSGVIAETALKIVDNDMTAFEKSRALYDYVVSTMDYDKTGAGWGRGDAIYACNAKKGNCTDFHSLFIAMARACGIPSRFVIGFPIPDGKKQGEIHGYHCWAEFYINGLGWAPIDASEARKHSEKKEMFFGGLDANRVQFTVGRDINIENNPNTEPLNYFIYPYVKIDGKIYSDVEKSFRFKDVTE